MKAHKYLKPLHVISAVSNPDNMMKNPCFFTVTSPDIQGNHNCFPMKFNKNERKFHSNTGSAG